MDTLSKALPLPNYQENEQISIIAELYRKHIIFHYNVKMNNKTDEVDQIDQSEPSDSREAIDQSEAVTRDQDHLTAQHIFKTKHV